ncbi:MAG: sulfotransferase [Bacteroidales bacterium]|nr:sulfotransferase [Bacteroidales bacterium]
MDSPVFILSTGRTGTQFFEDYINQTSDGAVCRHEPWPSRRFKFLSNLYLNQKVSHRLVGRFYQRSRRKLFRTLGNRTYIESSNFIFGCMPSLNEIYNDVRIIHIVRHPVSYVSSHLGKGFWRGHKRFFAKYVPYWLEILDVEDRSDPIQLLAARWNYVNRQIGSYEDSHPYLRIRFEDLFSGEAGVSSDRLNQIREFCGVPPLDRAENALWLQHPKNVSRHKDALQPGEVAFILATCSELMKEYQYTGQLP